MKKFIKFIVLILLFLLIVFGACRIFENSLHEENVSNDFLSEDGENLTSISNEIKEAPTFTSKEIPTDIYEKMLEKSIPTKYKDKIDISSLRYLQISYFGFDGIPHVRRNDCKCKACR